MKKLMFAVMVVMFMFLVLGLPVFAADRENFTVTTLRIGTEAVQVSGSSSMPLEKLQAGLFDGTNGVKYTVISTGTATNGKVCTLVAGQINVLTSQGSLSTSTNTITLSNAASTDVGKLTILENYSSSTNLLAISKTGNYYGPAIELNAGESVLLYTVATNKWLSIGQQ